MALDGGGHRGSLGRAGSEGQGGHAAGQPDRQQRHAAALPIQVELGSTLGARRPAGRLGSARFPQRLEDSTRQLRVRAALVPPRQEGVDRPPLLIPLSKEMQRRAPGLFAPAAEAATDPNPPRARTRAAWPHTRPRRHRDQWARSVGAAWARRRARGISAPSGRAIFQLVARKKEPIAILGR